MTRRNHRRPGNTTNRLASVTARFVLELIDARADADAGPRIAKTLEGLRPGEKADVLLTAAGILAGAVEQIRRSCGDAEPIVAQIRREWLTETAVEQMTKGAA